MLRAPPARRRAVCGGVAFKPGSSMLDQTSDPQLTHVSDALGYLIEAEMGLRQPGGARSERLI